MPFLRRACLGVVVVALGCGTDSEPTIGSPDGGGDGGRGGNTDGGGTTSDGGSGSDGGGTLADGGACGAVHASCSEPSPCCDGLVCQSRGPNPKPMALTCCVPVGGACTDLAECCVPPEGPAIQITCEGDAGKTTCQSNAL